MCAVAAILASLAAVTVVQQVGERSPVLALARDVPMGQQISEEDLVVAQAAADPALTPVTAGNLSQVVGQYAATGLRAGSLLTGGMLEAEQRLEAGQRLLGVEVRQSRMPADVLQAGDEILVVHTNTQSEGGSSPSQVAATVRSIGEPDTSGARMVNLAVASKDAADLGTWAAAGDIILVLEP
ncbi:SAF domain-containing protein [Streptomyces sp. SM12]|uniref:SAF domain-containing protein n=1 Tax=Streptomyces sp. SM12 TaxID=1071602 RepID=UPI0015E1854C|nr:SAF domain-containing protein [Streptomyces sp. SM12]